MLGAKKRWTIKKKKEKQQKSQAPGQNNNLRGRIIKLWEAGSEAKGREHNGRHNINEYTRSII